MELVGGGVEADGFEQALQLVPAALDVADEDPAPRSCRGSHAGQGTPGGHPGASAAELLPMSDPDEGYIPDWSNVARPRGIWVMLAIVAMGLLPAAYMAWHKANPVEPRTPEEIAALSTVEGRLEIWHDFGGPMIHNRIARFARASAEHPWIITHQIELNDGDPPEVWGIDASALPLELSRVEGRVVVVELPAPTLLGRAKVPAPDERKLPTYTDRKEVPDPAQRLESLAIWFLEKLPAALEKDIEGARLEVRVLPG